MQIRYLGDEDILHLMKNVYPSEYSEEYFNRNTRPIPVWKSEAEFRSIYNENERKIISNAIKKILAGNTEMNVSVEVNEKTLEEINDEISVSIENKLSNMVASKKHKKKLFETLLNGCKSHNIQPKIVLIPNSFFKSNFSKGEVQKLIIMFPNGRDKCRLQDVSTVLSSHSTNDDDLFYLYYYPSESREKVDVKSFAKNLVREFESILN